MGTMFQTGFGRDNHFWMGNGGRGGRAFSYGRDRWPYRYCDPAMEPCPTPFVGPLGLWGMGQAGKTREQILRDLNLAIDKLGAVNRWLENRPQYEQILGPDLPAFKALQAQVETHAAVATDVSQRLEGTTPETWYGTDDEIRRTYEWIKGVNKMYDLTLRHPEISPGGPAVPAPGVKPKPVPGPAPAPVASVSPLVIGIGAAVAVGIVAVALS